MKTRLNFHGPGVALVVFGPWDDFSLVDEAGIAVEGQMAAPEDGEGFMRICPVDLKWIEAGERSGRWGDVTRDGQIVGFWEVLAIECHNKVEAVDLILGRRRM